MGNIWIGPWAIFPQYADRAFVFDKQAPGVKMLLSPIQNLQLGVGVLTQTAGQRLALALPILKTSTELFLAPP